MGVSLLISDRFRRSVLNGRIINIGSSTEPMVGNTAGNKFINIYASNAAASGDSRGVYVRLYLKGSGTQGGEAGRFYTTVTNAAMNQGAHGVHCSLSFGASTGTITGLGCAGRFTLEVPDRALAGTTAPVMAEIYAEGTSSSATGTMAFIRCTVSGNATGATTMADQFYLIDINGSSDLIDDSGLIRTNTTTATHGIKCLLNGTRYDLLCSASHA